MSRTIDIGAGPLSEEDRDYLDSRGRLDLIAQNERLFSEPVALTKIDDGNTGDIDHFTADDSTGIAAGMHPAEMAPTGIQALEGQGISDLDDQDKDPLGLVSPVAQPSQDAGDGEADGDNYDDESVWSYKDLQEEAKSRVDVKASGSRSDVIAALRADDAADEDQSSSESTEDDTES